MANPLDLVTFAAVVVFSLVFTILGVKYREWLLYVFSCVYGILGLAWMLTYDSIQLSENGAVVQTYALLPFLVAYLFLAVIFPLVLLVKWKL